MATWDDDQRDLFHRLAGGLNSVADLCAHLIQTADFDEDITLLADTMTMLRDRSCIFSPPGEPQDGYPEVEGGAQVISLDAFREWRKIQTG
jgi:hypothetical protein